MNNSLKTINALATIISSKNTNDTQVKQINNSSEQLNDNTEQLNSDNIKTTTIIPKWLKNLKCIINPMSKDEESFQYSIKLSKHKEIGLNCNRINKIKTFLHHFNFNNINYPLKKEDYEMFERNNELTYLVVFRLDDKEKKFIFILNQNTLEKEEIE